jgi:hypothetical protein
MGVNGKSINIEWVIKIRCAQVVRMEEEVAKEGRMGLKIVHINRAEVSKNAAAKAFYENVLKPKWDAQARERALKLRAELMGVKPDTLRSLPSKNRG